MGKQGRIDIFFTKKRTKELDHESSSMPPPPPQASNNEDIPSNKYQKVETEGIDLNSLERDPGLRKQICEYHPNQRDDIRRAYIKLGRFKPILSQYPLNSKKTPRRFQASWYEKFKWLEYSPEKDKAFCFPCFLFHKTSDSNQNAFTVHGFNNWKKINSGVDCYFLGHMGKNDRISPHLLALNSFEALKNQNQQIERLFNTFTSEEIVCNRLRLKGSIDVVRFVALQGMAFRGHDESSNSLNRGNFLELIDLLATYNENFSKAKDNAPRNAMYISHDIQKQILHIFSLIVRKRICEEIGSAKFCILVDESRDESKKEQMSLVLRFVDKNGFIQERFFGLVHVSDTMALTLKKAIYSFLGHFGLNIQNIRGQGYDGASNMRGEFNGLQALISKDCKYAYYVHCFAHRLQLALIAASKSVLPIHKFFEKLTFIVNIVGASCKRSDELKEAHALDIAHLIDLGELETGRGLNQIGTLQRAGDTRWSSHLKSLSSLIKMFSAACAVLLNIMEDGLVPQKASAEAVYDDMVCFEFVFILHLMCDIMGITDMLCQALQYKSQDIVNAIELVSSTKYLLQELRDNKWDSLLMKVKSFCETRNIDIPDFTSRYINKRGQGRRNVVDFTIEQHYRVNLFNASIDSQLLEINDRFNNDAIELLTLSATLNPQNASGFKVENICKLVDKFYFEDFGSDDRFQLEKQLEHYKYNVVKCSDYGTLSSVSELCQWLVRTKKSDLYNLVFRIIVLVLTLPVSTATSERSFSAMNIVKTSNRIKMDDDFLSDALMIYIEREIAKSVSDDEIIKDFEDVKRRRVLFR